MNEDDDVNALLASINQNFEEGEQIIAVTENIKILNEDQSEDINDLLQNFQNSISDNTSEETKDKLKIEISG